MSSITKDRILSIDALRGTAALLVVFFHLFGMTALSSNNYLYFLSAFGYCGVYLFFVISGFCIHLRWAKTLTKNKDDEPKISFIAFWKRRWIRLYPAYIAAIVIFLVWEHYQGKLQFNDFFIWDMISHVLMIHNLDNETVYSMNGVFWTLAIEEQLYMLYFLLLYLRKKVGWIITLVITFFSRFLWLGISLLITKGIGFELPFNEGALANWWIWAMGAFAVESYYKVIKFPKWCYSLTLGTGFLIAAGSLHYFGLSNPSISLFARMAIIFEPFLWGAGFFFVVNRATSAESLLNWSGVRYRLLTVPAFVGLFSYSLYLSHELILQILIGTNRLIVCMVCLVFAYIFFLIFEKPFMAYLAKQRMSRLQAAEMEAF